MTEHKINISSLCVYCGSRMGNSPVYLEAARDLGALLARRGITIVYGGGHVGLMGVLADAALAAGGQVVGVIPKALQEKELGHTGLTELHVVETMHVRKAMMAERADAFIALPGGLGTYEEIFETATWSLLGIQDKPLGFLNINGFYDSLIDQVERAAADGFLLPDERKLVLTDTTGEGLITQLENFVRPGKPKWMTLHES